MGSIKWTGRPFSRPVAQLSDHRRAVPGSSTETRLVTVSKAGVPIEGADVNLGPTDLIDAWR